MLSVLTKGAENPQTVHFWPQSTVAFSRSCSKRRNDLPSTADPSKRPEAQHGEQGTRVLFPARPPQRSCVPSLPSPPGNPAPRSRMRGRPSDCMPQTQQAQSTEPKTKLAFPKLAAVYCGGRALHICRTQAANRTH